MNKFELIEENKKKEKKSYKRIFKLYILPIVALVTFLTLIFTFVIPKIGRVIEKVNEINNLNNEVSKDLKEISNLQVLSSQFGIIQENLEILNSIAPAGQTEVVNFQQKLTEISQNYGLLITNQVFNDNKINDTDLQLGALVLRQIPTRFEVSGEKQNVLSFLDEISALDDFIVIEQMELTSQGINSGNDNGIWNLSLIMVKYQFSEQDLAKLNEQFLQVPSTSKPNQSVVDYIEKRKELTLIQEEITEQNTGIDTLDSQDQTNESIVEDTSSIEVMEESGDIE
jgi:Tfp pilus assembly protein PilO